MFPETNVNIPSARTDTAEVPAANPSIPSVKLAPLETAVIIKITTGIKINHAHFSYPSPVQAKALA
ncbi:hypothetical protein D3C80_1065130 [compost metagenome]